MHIHEPEPPDGVKPLEWFLLTSLPVASDRDAERILKWYRLRWRIEDWHRVLKSGCKVEYLGHRTGDRIERAVTINAVIAWRLTAMTMMGRETPELPADILFSDIEIMALEDFASDRKLLAPGNLGLAVLTMAMLADTSTARTTRGQATRKSGRDIRALRSPRRPTKDSSGWTAPATCIRGCVPTRLVGKRQAAAPANMHRPRFNTFLAAFSSRSSSRPHTPHRWIRSDGAFGTFVQQREQSCDVSAGGTSTNGMPALSALPFRESRNSRQPCCAIARVRSCFPGPREAGS